MKIISNKPTITRKDLEAVLDCLINDQLTTGGTVKTFENEVSEITGHQYSLATNSLTAAYHLVFMALNLQPGDEVVMPSFFDTAPLSALALTGATAVLADSDASSLFPSEGAILERITPRTKAVIMGHSFGFHDSKAALRESPVPVIEDISHALGTMVDETPVGAGAAFAVASFASSMIITTGNGGMVMTNNSRHYSVMRDMRNGSGAYPSFDYTMTDLQGAMGITQVHKIKELLDRRRTIAKIYHDALKITEHKTFYTYSDDFAYQSFPVIFDASIEKVEKYWKKAGVEITNPVKPPLHAHIGAGSGSFPNSERLSKKLFTVPLYPTLTRDNIDYIARSISKFI